MRLGRLWLTDFRCYRSLELELPGGCTVVVGANGQGKTSLLESVGWVATGRSFRGVPDAALVREGVDTAIVRAEVSRTQRRVLVEAELRINGRNRVLVNGSALTSRRALSDGLRVTVFSPDDLELVKGGPVRRRDFLDDLLVATAPRYRVTRSELERVLRHRNALLRHGVRDAEARTTLEVFDEQLVRAGGEIVRGRLRLGEQLGPLLARAYADLAEACDPVAADYEAEWADGPLTSADADGLLRDALVALRRREEDRGQTLVGPHRDEWRLRLSGLDTRTHASQGEQRTLALALRLAGHRLVADVLGEEPLLLLDDVFSELDAHRTAALVDHLPPGQTLVTTAGAVPEGVDPQRRLRVHDGRVEDAP